MGYAFCFNCTKILPTNYYYQKIYVGDMPNPMIKCPRCGEAAPEIDELIIGVCSWLYQHGIFTMFSCSGHIDDLYGSEDRVNQMYILIYGEPLTKIIEEHPLPRGFRYEIYNEPRPWDNILPGGRLIQSQEPMTVSIIRKNINCYTEMPWVRIQKRNNCIQSLMRWLIKNEEAISEGMGERMDFLESLPYADTSEYSKTFEGMI